MEEAAPVPGSALGLSGGCAELLYSFSGLHELYNCLELAFAGLQQHSEEQGWVPFAFFTGDICSGPS